MSPNNHCQTHKCATRRRSINEWSY